MEFPWIQPSPEFYQRLNHYISTYGLPWDLSNWRSDVDEAVEYLRPILGEGRGRRALDVSCGWGLQYMALAHLGWRVTGSDVSETSLEVCRIRAAEAGVYPDLHLCDMRDAGSHFGQEFDLVVSCYGLYEIPDAEGVQAALKSMRAVLKPAGVCYLQMRDMDFLLEEKPRHQFHGERRGDGWRMICIEDWDFESESNAVMMYAFLLEDENYPPGEYLHWQAETIGVRKYILRKAELERWLNDACFTSITHLPQSAPWMPVEYLSQAG